MTMTEDQGAMTDLEAYVRFNGSSWEYLIKDGYSVLVVVTTFDDRSHAENAARKDVKERNYIKSLVADATEWERIEI